MDYDDIFTAFYAQYRADADTPASTDDEYTIGLRLANEAINHWSTFDGTLWKELWTTHQLDGGGTQTITTNTSTYTCSTNMQKPGGVVVVKDSSGNVVQNYRVIEPHQAQFESDNSTYAYFRGNATSGYTLVLNPSPPARLNGLDIDFAFYKKPTEFSIGADKTEMSNPYFIVHRMLANRFRASRNPYYEDALRDAENALAKMKLDNDSGSWANPWKLTDYSGSEWGF